MEKFRNVLDNNQTIIILVLVTSIIGGNYFKGRLEKPNKIIAIFLTGIIVLTILYFVYMMFLK